MAGVAVVCLVVSVSGVRSSGRRAVAGVLHGGSVLLVWRGDGLVALMALMARRRVMLTVVDVWIWHVVLLPDDGLMMMA